MSITVKIHSQLDKKFQQIERELRRAVASELIAIAEEAAEELADRTRRRIALPDAFIQDSITVTPATPSRPVATLAAADKRAPLELFPHVKNAHGAVIVQIEPGKALLLKHARIRDDNGRIIRFFGYGRVRYLHGPNVRDIAAREFADMAPAFEQKLADNINRRITNLS